MSWFSGFHHRHRFRRRLFAAIGVTILFATLISSGTIFAVGGAFGSWRKDAERGTRFAGQVFADRWDSKEERARLAQLISDEFHLNVVTLDSNGETLEVFGEACVRRDFRVAVQRDGKQLGEVRVCSNQRSGPGALVIVGWLTLFGTVLWAAAGHMARRFLSPLDELVAVTEKLGHGELATRARVRRHDELGILAKAINEMANQIEQQMEEQRTLLAQVSHELRTPLGHLKLLTELTREGAKPPAEACDEMDREISELDALVGELLVTSRIDRGMVERRALSAREVLETALTRAGVEATLAEVRTGQLSADPTLIGRALGNLLVNARIHGRGVRRLVVEPFGREFVRLYVDDAGPGIPADDLPRIFEPFFRGARAPVDESRPGLGMGLALVARVATAHDGRAFAENRAEGGARVGFTIRSSISDDRVTPPV